jgi:hypothetical protein
MLPCAQAGILVCSLLTGCFVLLWKARFNIYATSLEDNCGLCVAVSDMEI